jgi:hypothetical protein
MTTTEAITAHRAPDGTGQAPARLITRPLLVRFVSVVGSATSFYLLLSAVRQVGQGEHGHGGPDDHRADPLQRGHVPGHALADGAVRQSARPRGWPARAGAARAGGVAALAGLASVPGPASDGAASDGAASGGAASDGAASGGAASDGAASGGAASDGAASGGAGRQAWPREAAAWRRSTHHGPFGIMPLIFLAGSAAQIPVNFCGGALAILGFADVGGQSGAAAFPRQLQRRLPSNGTGWPSPGAGHPLGVGRPLSWLSWSSHHPTSGTHRGLERVEP